MFDLPKDLWSFMRERKKFWLTPVIAVLLLVGAARSFGRVLSRRPVHIHVVLNKRNRS